MKNIQPHQVKECERLIEEHFRVVSYRYDADTVLLEYDLIRKKFQNENEFQQFLSIVNYFKNIVFYLPKNKSMLLQKFLDWGFENSGNLWCLMANFLNPQLKKKVDSMAKKFYRPHLFGRYEFFQGKAKDHPGIEYLLHQYLATHQVTFLDGFGDVKRIFNDIADYHYFEAHNGDPLAINKMINSPISREGEITFGMGTPRQNLMMMLRSIQEEMGRQTSLVEINVPYESVARLLCKLGFQYDSELVVLVRPRKESVRPRERRDRGKLHLPPSDPV